MKNSDEAVDRVLAGLREAAAPQGMERRMLAAVQQRAETPRSLPLRWAAAGGFALAATALVALVAVPRHSAAPPALQAVVAPQTQPLPAALPAPAAARPRRHTPAIRANAEAPAPTPGVLTASFPAPPMPLTEQERLLVEVARLGEPKAVPVLDPNALAQQEAHSEQAFENLLATAREPSNLTHKEDTQ